MKQYFYRKLGNIIIIAVCIMMYQSVTIYRKQEAEIVNLNQQIQAMQSNTVNSSESVVQETTAAGTYQDGEYIGKAQGFGGMITVKVIIADQMIKEVLIVNAEQEDKAYLDMAKVLVDKMVMEQSCDLDAVSGATYSSNGIIDAAKQALEQAVVK